MARAHPTPGARVLVTDGDDRAATTWVDRWPWVLAVALAAATPTLLSIVAGPSFMVDDWTFAATAREEGLGAFLHGIDVRSRPFQAAYHGITFVVLGDHPVLHLLLLAALNGLVAVLFLRALRKVFAPIPALLAVAWFVALPNHDATRLWISTGPIVLAQALLAGAAIVALGSRPRAWLVFLLVAASALSYEGGILIGAALLLVACLRARPQRWWPSALAWGGALAGVAVWVRSTSPKAGSATSLADSVDALLPSQVGSAILPEALAAASGLVLVALLVAAVANVLPSFRRATSWPLMAAGAVVAALGIAPFVVSGFPLSTDGMLDRSSSFAAFGVAMLLAGACDHLLRLPPPVAGTLIGVALVVVASGHATDIRGAADAQRDGRDLLAALADSPYPPGTRIVVAPMPNHGGYAAFGYQSLGPAWSVVGNRPLDLRDTLTEAELAAEPGIHVRWVDGALVAEP